MSIQTKSRSGYFVQHQNEGRSWEHLRADKRVSDTAEHWEDHSWINAMIQVMPYEDALAVIAAIKDDPLGKSRYRICRWELTYELSDAFDSDDMAGHVDSLFAERNK